MQSLKDPEVTISVRIQRITLRGGGERPLSATHPRAIYPGGATGTQTQQCSDSISSVSKPALPSLSRSPRVDQRS
jgi:hypothetical protein